MGGSTQARREALPGKSLTYLFSSRCSLRDARGLRVSGAERIKYAIRHPANQVLQGRIRYLLKRPAGRPPNEVRRFYANFSYQAGTWTKPRRVIAKVEWHPGEL